MISQINQFDLISLLALNRWASDLPTIFNKIFAEYLVYFLPILFIWMFFFWDRKAKFTIMRAFLSTILAWPIIATIIGKIVLRPRPFQTGGVQELIFHRPTYSFPSDHAAALFAVSLSFYLSGYKKLSYIMFAASITICFFRIATAIHWPTDIFAGIIVGLASAIIINALEKPLIKVYNFVLEILHKVKLA